MKLFLAIDDETHITYGFADSESLKDYAKDKMYGCSYFMMGDDGITELYDTDLGFYDKSEVSIERAEEIEREADEKIYG